MALMKKPTRISLPGPRIGDTGIFSERVQRCQWHKLVVSYLATTEQPLWRQRLQRAYHRPESQILGSCIEMRNLNRRRVGSRTNIGV